MVKVEKSCKAFIKLRGSLQMRTRRQERKEHGEVTDSVIIIIEDREEEEWKSEYGDEGEKE